MDSRTSKTIVEEWLLANVGKRCPEEFSTMCTVCSIWKKFDQTQWPTVEPKTGVAPIARVTIKDGLVVEHETTLYAPGLPDGEHDLFPVPVGAGEWKPFLSSSEPPRVGPDTPDNDMVICPTCTSQFVAIPVNAQEKLRTAQERIAWAWSIIANVSEGDWSKQTQLWQDAAAQWEQVGDPYEGLASRNSTAVTKETGL